MDKISILIFKYALKIIKLGQKSNPTHSQQIRKLTQAQNNRARKLQLTQMSPCPVELSQLTPTRTIQNDL